MTYHLLRQEVARVLSRFLSRAEASREASLWMERGFNRDRAWMALHGGTLVSAEERAQVEEWMERRALGEPMELILGWTVFCGHRFRVVPGVLVPQIESEALVRAALELGRAFDCRTCVDVGCGAGNVGLSLALETDWALTLTEIERRALAAARENARLLGLTEVRFLVGDLLEPVGDPLDLVVANLPYVDVARAPQMAQELAFEPAVAMLAGEGGTALSRRLLLQARRRGARVCLVEIGDAHGEALREHAHTLGWNHVDVRRDGSGRDRILAVW